MGVKKREIHQGDIYMVNLSIDSIDHEQAGIRPCCIVSCDNRNEKSNNVFVFPITHAVKKKQPCHYRLYKKQYDFFSYDVNTVLCEEGRSISKKRLERKLGSIDLRDLLEILKIKEYIFIEKTI
mgnify:FL=1